MQTQDILILGGGPAGVSTALHLVRDFPHLIPRILILEKEHYPRPKLCAGGLVIDAEIILERLGLDVGEVPHVDAPAAHFDFAGKGLKISAPKRHTLRIIRRDEFDAWLAKKAADKGVALKEGVTVRKVIPDSEGVTVETNAGSFRAQVVVGADGSNGVTRRCVLPHAPLSTARLLEVITPMNPHRPTDTSPKFSEFGGGREGAYFDFFPVPKGIAGYVWDFPTQIKGQPMRCWGVYDTNLLAGKKRPALREPLAEEMARHGFDLDEYELKGYPIRWFDPFHPLSTPRVLLVGDAAGADPIFGEGISMALGYGAVAATEIGRAFQRGDFSFSGYRRRALMGGLGQTLVTRWIVAQIIYPIKWKWFQVLLWRWLKPVVSLLAWVFVLNWSKRL